MNNMRLSGLASGMDTDSMVQSMMKIERMKVDRVEQNKQVAMWRQESYNNMNKAFANFIINSRKDMGLSKTSNTGILSHNNYTKLEYLRKANSSDESKATVSSTNKAINGSYTIDVKEMAKGASFTSVNMEEKTDFLKEGMTFTLSNGVNDEGEDINVANIVIKSSAPEKGVQMSDVVKAINAEKDTTGITAFTNNGRLFLQTTETGEGQSIKLSKAEIGEGITQDNVNKGDEFIEALGYGKANMDGTKNVESDGESASYIIGKQAKIEYNGVTLKYDSNNIDLNGLNIQLRSQGTTTINVDTNVDGIMEKVEKLIEDYNELIEKTSKAVDEKRYASYHPLSQEEKKAMHEDDVKLWEEKARSGMLNRDETINRTMQNVRNELYKTVDTNGKFKHITELGITTEKYSKGSTGGKLVIDSAKLRAAILDDPEGVMELLFTENEEAITNPEELAEGKKAPDTTQGAFTRVFNGLIDGMKAIVDKSGPGEDSNLLRDVRSNLLIDFVTKKSSISDIDRQVLDMNKKIDSLNVMLGRREDAHYAKFTAMEKYMHQMNNQSNWLMQQFM